MDEEGSDLFPPRKNFYYGGKKMITERIQAELHALGITPCYRGYEQLACAVELAVSNEADLKDITKRIYWVVAEKCGCKRSCVERRDICGVALQPGAAAHAGQISAERAAYCFEDDCHTGKAGERMIN